MPLSTVNQPAELYEAMLVFLVDKLSSSVKITPWETWGPAKAHDYQVLLEFGEMNEGALQNDGRQAQEQEVVLYAVVSKGVEQSALMAMNMASQLARLVVGQRWGLPASAVGEPQRIVAQPSFLIDKGDNHAGFEAWEVRLVQVVKYGAVDLGAGELFGELAFAVAPQDISDGKEYEVVT